MVPCDRTVEVAATVAGAPPDADCAVEMWAPGGASPRVRRSRLDEGAASFTIGPFGQSYVVRVRCERFAPSVEREVDFAGVERVDLGEVRVGAGQP